GQLRRLRWPQEQADGGPEQVLFRPEVVMDQGRVDPRFPGDPPDRGGVIPVLGKGRPRRRQDRPAGVGVPRPPAGPRHQPALFDDERTANDSSRVAGRVATAISSPPSTSRMSAAEASGTRRPWPTGNTRNPESSSAVIAAAGSDGPNASDVIPATTASTLPEATSPPSESMTRRSHCSASSMW